MAAESAIILLVEDREEDILLIRKSFVRAGLINPLYVVRNGEEAVAYLLKTQLSLVDQIKNRVSVSVAIDRWLKFERLPTVAEDDR